MKKFCLALTPQGYFGVYAWQEYKWTKLRVYYTRAEAEAYLKEISDLPKYK